MSPFNTISFVTLLSWSSLAGQHQNNIWCFGLNGGLNFNTSPPTVFQSQINAQEGCASISDKNGNLLFYTNGQSVWDQNHMTMPNGTGLAGGTSSTQSALIIPLPNSSNKYYIFTTEDQFTDGGLSYSIVNMDLNNGQGDVEPSNKNILIADQVSEKLTSILHRNGIDIWVLCHKLNSNEFISVLLTESGLNSTPILSQVGYFYPTNARIGTIKASQNGQKVVSSVTGASTFEMFDFNTLTGELSNPIDLASLFQIPINVYGIEFSSNSKFLYFSSQNSSGILCQIELENLKTTTLATNQFSEIGALQLGPDNKIYISRYGSKYVDVIHNPTYSGHSCQYQKNWLPLAQGTNAFSGLPNLAPYSSIFSSKNTPELGQDLIICNDTQHELSVAFPENCFGISYLWSNGTMNSNLIVDSPGEYWVEILSTCGLFRDTIYIDTVTCIPIVYYDMEDCRSYMSDNSLMDYSEFIPYYPTSLECANIHASVVYRSPAKLNKHSCTPGYDGSIAMCIGADLLCNPAFSTISPLIIDFDVSQAINSAFIFSGLQFHQKAPELFDWIDGPSGPNNYPTLFGITIYKNGQEIYYRNNFTTTLDWSLITVDFNSIEPFIIDDTTSLRIEILPYCPIGIDAEVSVWDVDNISILGYCTEPLPTVEWRGSVNTPKENPLVGVEINISRDSTFTKYITTYSNQNGYFHFKIDSNLNTFYIRCIYESSFLEGVTIQDLLLIQKHLLGVRPFTSIFELVSSDLDANGIINVIDLLSLKKSLLGIIQEFPNNMNWKFGKVQIDGKEELNIYFNGWGKIKHADHLNFEINLVGVKIGDVNGTIY